MPRLMLLAEEMRMRRQETPNITMVDSVTGATREDRREAAILTGHYLGVRQVSYTNRQGG